MKIELYGRKRMSSVTYRTETMRMSKERHKLDFMETKSLPIMCRVINVNRIALKWLGHVQCISEKLCESDVESRKENDRPCLR